MVQSANPHAIVLLSADTDTHVATWSHTQQQHLMTTFTCRLFSHLYILIITIIFLIRCSPCLILSMLHFKATMTNKNKIAQSNSRSCCVAPMSHSFYTLHSAAPFPPPKKKLPLPMRDTYPHLINRSMGQPNPPPQTAS